MLKIIWFVFLSFSHLGDSKEGMKAPLRGMSELHPQVSYLDAPISAHEVGFWDEDIDLQEQNDDEVSKDAHPLWDTHIAPSYHKLNILNFRDQRALAISWIKIKQLLGSSPSRYIMNCVFRN